MAGTQKRKAPDDADDAGSSRQASSTVKIKVIEDKGKQKIFTFTADAVVKVSKYFASVFNDSANTKHVYIELDNTTIEALTMFERWLQKDEQIAVYSSPSREMLYNFKSGETAVYLYILARDYRIDILKYHVIRYFVASSLSVAKLEHIEISAELIQLVYDKAEDTPLCRLLVEYFIAERYDVMKDKDTLMKYPKAFLADVLQAISARY